jgi:SAM-dependent methyltransferase
MQLSPAADAFDAVAPAFDARFGTWKSVAAQRRAVRDILAASFPPGSRLFEIGGGTGEDARWLCARGRHVVMTDASPAMVAIASAKLAAFPQSRADAVAAENLCLYSADRTKDARAPFDGAYSNFAALNCVADLEAAARGLAQLVRPGGVAALVLFGIAAPGDVVVECLRGRANGALRRWQAGPVKARLGGHSFEIVYHRPRAVIAAMRPWFRLERRIGIGIFVPPSAAEPWISRHPRLLGAMEALDRIVQRPLAALGDHILYQFRRTTEPA